MSENMYFSDPLLTNSIAKLLFTLFYFNDFLTLKRENGKPIKNGITLIHIDLKAVLQY